MSNHDDFDENASSRTYAAPYTPRKPIPTIQRYQAHKDERQADAQATIPEKVEEEVLEDSGKPGLLDSTKRYFHLDGPLKDKTVDQEHPYPSQNRNHEALAKQDDQSANDRRGEGEQEEEEEDKGHEKSEENGAARNHNESDQSKENGGSILKDTSEAIDSTLNPRQKRKNMKHMKRDHAAREVTDPVTHLKVTIHDTTNKELKTVPENEPPPGSNPRSATGCSAESKSKSELDRETEEQQADHRGMEKMFPPPSLNATREEIATVFTLAFTVGMGSLLAVCLFLLIGSHLIKGSHGPKSQLGLLVVSSLLLITGLTVGGGVIWGLRGWLNNRIRGIWEDELWTAARKQEQETAESPTPESTQWLNSILSSVWSLINPDLFASLADTLEDVMQASLPKLVRMVGVEDLGQGSEAIRILGVRWLPTGAAARNVSKDGEVKPGKGHEQSDRKVPGDGDVDDDTKADGEEHRPDEKGKQGKGNGKKEEGEEENIAEGMEAEEGDFVNVEVAFSYRASSSGNSIRVKSKNAHLYLAFYLPGSIRFRKLVAAVWFLPAYSLQLFGLSSAGSLEQCACVFSSALIHHSSPSVQ